MYLGQVRQNNQGKILYSEGGTQTAYKLDSKKSHIKRDFPKHCYEPSVQTGRRGPTSAKASVYLDSSSPSNLARPRKASAHDPLSCGFIDRP